MGSVKIYIFILLKDFLRELGAKMLFFTPLAPLYNTIDKLAKIVCMMPRAIAHNF
jgi:hypothetical protein